MVGSEQVHRLLSHADMLPGELVGQSGGGFSLDNASSGLADGLNAMSKRLNEHAQLCFECHDKSPLFVRR
jgi:hypothetical protein